MAAPVGLDREQVLSAAVDVLQERGRVDGVSLSEVAGRLGVRTQSLYAHVDGAADLRRALALAALAELADVLTRAAIGREGRNAIGSIVHAYYRFAIERPGLYDATLVAPGDDEDLLRAIEAVTRPLNLVLESFGLQVRPRMHWYRIIFAGVHGFATLSRDGLLTMPADAQESLGRMISAFVDELESEAADNRKGKRRP
jgi:AcrR family transcriptional regulator